MSASTSVACTNVASPFIFFDFGCYNFGDPIQSFLIASLKQNHGYYQDIINANHPYPCSICQKDVNGNQKSIFCNNYNHWVHIKCNGTSVNEYNTMMEENFSYTQALCLARIISPIHRYMLSPYYFSYTQVYA